MLKNKHYDVIIIGAGVGGLSAAKTLIDTGLRVLLVEKDKLGGKTIHGGGSFISHVFQSIKFMHKIDNKESWSIKGDSSQCHIDFSDLMENYDHNKDQVIERYKENIFSSDIEFIKGQAQLIDPTHVYINDEIFETRSIILAHGSKFRTPNFKGLGQALSNDFVVEPTNLSSYRLNPKHILVLGEGRIAFENVEMLARLGVKVTFVCQSKYILSRVDTDVRDLIISNIRALNVEVIDQYDEIEFENKTVKVISDDKEQTFSPDYCILAMGYIKDDYVLGKVDLETNKDGIVTNDFCQTSIDNIYAIGDANDKLKLSNVAIREGQIAANHIQGRQIGLNYNGFVSGIMGVYEYSQLGMTEEEIKTKGIPYYPYTLKVDSSQDFNFTKTPLLKIYLSKITHEILGIHLLGENGSEQMTQLLSLLNPPASYRTMNVPVQSRLQRIKDEVDMIRNQLVHDLIENSLKFVYQAVMDNKTHQIVGYESLSRFYIDGKMVLPLPIITMLEESGKIAQLDFKSLEQAGITLKKLKEQGIDTSNISIYINVSSNTIISEDAEKFYNAARKNECPINQIVLEVTERQVINNSRVLRTLDKLRAYGFLIVLDDFSIGHASLSLLSKFHFDKVKLDADLLPNDENDIIRLKSFIDLVELIQIYEVKLVAEGIETEFQATLVQSLPVERVQGYYFHRPQKLYD